MISGVSLAQPNNVAFEGRLADAKKRFNKMSKKEKAVRISAAVAGTAALGTAIIVRKDIKTLFKTKNFKQFFKDSGKTLKAAGKSFVEFLKHPVKTVKGWFGKKGPERNVFQDLPRYVSDETKTAVSESREALATYLGKQADDVMARVNPKGEYHKTYQKELTAMFKNLTEHQEEALAFANKNADKILGK